MLVQFSPSTTLEEPFTVAVCAYIEELPIKSTSKEFSHHKWQKITLGVDMKTHFLKQLAIIVRSKLSEYSL